MCRAEFQGISRAPEGNVEEIAAAFRSIRTQFLQRTKNVPNDPNDPNDPNVPNVSTEWLLKPLASGGGRHIERWDGGVVPPRHYLQERIEGIPGSIVFVAAGGRAVPLGITRQLVGEGAFGASGYQYCGNLLGRVFDDSVTDRAAALASAVAGAFGLVGLNGIDFIVRDGVPYPVEVNPRWCASMELVERAYGVSVFGAHAAACAAGRLPDFDFRAVSPDAAVVGKAIVFARADLGIGDTRAWLDDPTVRDVPPPGQRIRKGSPVCTVFAIGADPAACREALIRRAEGLTP